METSPEPTPAKRKCTTADVSKMNLVETIREFDLPQQFPSMLNELKKKADETENLCDKIVSTSAVPLTPQFVSKVQKLRILSRNGRDLGEFNVQLRDDESRGKTIMLTKSPSKNDPVTIIRTSYNSGKLCPRILRQSKNLTNRLNVNSPNVTLLSQNISRVGQINTMWHQQSTTLPKSNEFRSTNDVENRKVIASNSDDNIDIETSPTTETVCKSGKSCPRILKQSKNLNRLDIDVPNITFLGRTIPRRDVIMIEQQQSTNLLKSNKFRSSNKRKEKLAEKRKVKANNSDVEIDVETISTNKNTTNKTIFINKNSTCSNKNDIKSLSAANCKNLVVRLTNCMKTSENKEKCIANTKPEKGQVESLKNKEYNQDRKSTEGSSFKNKSFLDKSRITDEKNMLQSKSFSNKQENIMTIIPNNETVSLNQSAHFLSNTYASSTSNKNMINPVEHVQESQRVVSTTDTNMKSNVQNKDLSSKLDIIKKAMDSVKDSELRELALKALADCGIGIERYVPVRPPEQHKAVHDSQVQTVVFGLLDPKSFILINKDIESLYRINQITLHDEPIAEPTGEREEEEDNFDIDSFINEFIKGIENDSDVLKINETLSMSRLRCRNILNHLERDFQSAKQYDRNGRLNIHNAVLSNDVRLVQKHLLVLRHCKESVDIPTETGMTSLELAIKYDVCKEIVKILLDAGAQPVVPIYLHESALIIASKQSSSLLPMLVRQVPNCALLDHIDSEGYAALHYCSIHGNLQGVQVLLSAGATIDLQDKKSGRTPLFHALDNSHKSVAETLLKAGAMAHIVNYAGQTPIISIPTTLTEMESSP